MILTVVELVFQVSNLNDFILTSIASRKFGIIPNSSFAYEIDKQLASSVVLSVAKYKRTPYYLL